ncbi:MAG TPA: hypothetical protein VIT65_04170 [Microlunatus sp.]
MTRETLQMEFRRGDASADELQQVVDEVLAELSAPDSEVGLAAQHAGLDANDLVGVEVSVREGQQGAEPVLTTILVGILVSAGSKVAESLWKDVIWPRIRKRLGWTAVKDEIAAGADGAVAEEDDNEGGDV